MHIYLCYFFNVFFQGMNWHPISFLKKPHLFFLFLVEMAAIQNIELII